MGWFPSSLFRRKDVEHLLGEMNEGERLHRRLGPIALMGLGIGATIGTGLYVQTGRVANELAGPSIILSFVLAAIGCAFAAVCYAELASMVPVAGSAYTYAYATLGELVAWIIGWDLILEYAIGSSVVAAGWSNYFDALLRHALGFSIDPRLQAAPWDYDVAKGIFYLKKVALDDGQMVQAWINVPAIFITAAVTAILVVGIRESAGFNAAMVLLNIGVILTVIGIGAAYVTPENWRPFFHEDHGWRGAASGAGRVFFAYIGFDSISTHAEEARRPQRDLAIGILGALTVCTVLYVSVAAILTGMLPYRQIDIRAPLAAALHAKGLNFAGGLVTLGILAGMTSSLLVGNLSQPRILLAMARDGLLPHALFAAVHPRFKTPWKSTILVGVVVATAAALAPLEFLADLVSIGTLFAFVIVSAAVWIMRLTDPHVHRPFRAPLVPLVSTLGILVNGGMMFFLGPENWLRLFIWLILGLMTYFGFSRRHSALRARATEATDPA
jgi:basic amino acid/polyamine antiporter, APA family